MAMIYDQKFDFVILQTRTDLKPWNSIVYYGITIWNWVSAEIIQKIPGGFKKID